MKKQLYFFSLCLTVVLMSCAKAFEDPASFIKGNYVGELYLEEDTIENYCVSIYKVTEEEVNITSKQFCRNKVTINYNWNMGYFDAYDKEDTDNVLDSVFTLYYSGPNEEDFRGGEILDFEYRDIRFIGEKNQ